MKINIRDIEGVAGSRRYLLSYGDRRMDIDLKEKNRLMDLIGGDIATGWGDLQDDYIKVLVSDLKETRDREKRKDRWVVRGEGILIGIIIGVIISIII